MGKLTISMAIFNSYVTNYQRVEDFPHFAGEGLFLYKMCHVSFSAAPTLRRKKRMRPPDPNTVWA